MQGERKGVRCQVSAAGHGIRDTGHGAGKAGARAWGLGAGAGGSFRLSTIKSSTACQGSGEFVEGHVAAGWGSCFKQGFDAAHGFGCEEHVAANVADLGGNMVDHHHLAPVFDGVDDRPRLIDAGASP